VLTLGALRFGVDRATGQPAHGLVGLAVYAIACAALLLAARAMPRAPRRSITRAA
jgi:hypothetical protein